MKLPIEDCYREISRFNEATRLNGEGLPSVKKLLCIYKIQAMLFKVH